MQTYYYHLLVIEHRTREVRMRGDDLGRRHARELTLQRRLRRRRRRTSP